MTTETDTISLEMLRQLLSIQNNLNDGLQSRLNRIKNRLVELVYRYSPQESDRQARAGQPPETHSEEALIEKLHSLLERAKNADRPTVARAAGEPIQYIQARLRQAEERVQRLEQEKQQLNGQLELVRNQMNALKQVGEQIKADSPIPTTQVKPRVEVTTPPDWLTEWKNGRGYENEERVIRLIGESGLARRPALVALAQKVYQMGASSFHYSLDRLIEREMVEKAGPVEKTASIGIDLLILTDLGKTAYQHISASAAAESEYAIFAHHSSPEHALLILEAADVLCAENYQVMLKDTENILLENGCQVRPDLVAKDPQGKLVFIEVERDAYKGLPRVDKWRNLHAATHGELYIICENYACLCQVRNETNQVLEGLPYTRCLTDLRSLHGTPGRGIAPKRNAKDGSMWIEKKVTE